MRSLLNELEIASAGPWPPRAPERTTEAPMCHMCNERPRRIGSSGRVFSYCNPCHNKRIREHQQRMRDVQKRKNEI